MNIFYPFIYSVIFFVLIFVVVSILIMSELQKRDIKINFFLLRLLLPKYVHQYKKITKKETGKVGALFYYWIISINLALVSFIVGMIFK